MAKTDLETLQISLNADLKQYEKALAKASSVTVSQLRKIEGNAAKSMGRVEKSWARFGDGFKAGIVGALGGVGIDRAIRGIMESVDKLNDIGEIAGRTGFTTDLVQGFQELGREATAEIENVNKALQSFSEQAATADSFLDKLFKANDRKIDLSNPQKNLETFMDLVKNAGSAAEQLRIVTGVVGDRAGRELTEAFARGGDAVVTAFSKMEGAGRAHSAVQIEEAGKIKAKFVTVAADIQSVWEKLAVTIGTPLAGALDTFHDDLKKIIGDITKISDLIDRGEYKQALKLSLFGERKPPGTFGGKGSPIYTLPGKEPPATTIPKTGGTSDDDETKAEKAKSDAIKRLIDFSIEQQHRQRELDEEQLARDQELIDSKKALASATYDAFEAIVIGGENASDVIKNLAQSLLQAATQAALFGQGPFASLFNTAGSGGLLGKLFGQVPGRASGGPVSAGKPYIVGERAPELFVPSQSGSIVPKIRGGGGNFTLIDQRTNAPAVEHRRDGQGNITAVIRDAVDSHFASGRGNKVMGAQFGISPQKARR